jgi:hypothetical protein
MIAELPLGQAKCFSRNQQSSDKSAAGHTLTVAAVAFECHDRFGRAFVTNGPADASSGKWNSHRIFSVITNKSAETRHQYSMWEDARKAAAPPPGNAGLAGGLKRYRNLPDARNRRMLDYRYYRKEMSLRHEEIL